MGTFLHAVRQHRAVVVAHAEDPRQAADLWNAIVGVGTLPTGSFAEAVADTAPVTHAALLTMDDVAAAYAFDLFWTTSSTTASPYELRTLARERWGMFIERAQTTAELASGFGWDVNAAWAHTQDVTLASGDMSTVERIARLAGRMYVALRGARAGRVHGIPTEVYSVEQGNNIGRLLPSELVLLTEPLLETVVLERIASRRAAQYAVRGDAKQSKGPLVIALDESGSMRGRRNEWAKAATVALARVAMDQKRSVSVVHYSTSAVVQPLKPGDASAMLSMVRHFLGGGTAIGLALGVAVQEVRNLARKHQKGADVVLVTDGVDGDESAQAKAIADGKTLGARLWTVAIECDVPESSPLRAEAAEYSRLGASDLNEGSVVRLAGAA
jgi:Mg-chelatase subunit ChlD